ncbi:MAG: peptidylprolyl isomerase [Bacteroidota bacterium]
MKKLTILIVGLLGACSGIGIFNSEDNILISIGEESVTTEEFLYAFNKNRTEDSSASREEIDEYLALYTNFKLKVIEARTRGMDTTSEFIKEYESYKGQLDDTYIKSNDDIDSFVKEAFERLQYEVKAAHILFALEEGAMPGDTLQVYNRALTVRDSILNGASFNNVARAVSEDPSAKQNGGELGYFTVLQMVYPFESAAYKTNPGEISMPVQTKFGYHLIKIIDKRRNEGKVQVAHIMIRPGNGDKEKVFELYDKLIEGANWDELCAQNSDDQQTAARKGVLMPFAKAQMLSAPNFAEVAFNLDEPGQISDPVQTNYGWHIIKLIEKLPVDNFEENERRLRSQVKRDSRSQIGHEKMLERLASENKLIENEQNIQLVIDPENHSYVKNKWIFKEDSLGGEVLFTINNKNHLASGLYELIEKDNNQKPDKGYLFGQFKQYREKCLIDYEKAHLDQKYPDYKYLRQEYHDGILLFSIMEDEVWLKASTDSVGLKKYYESHLEDYIDSTRVKAAIFNAKESWIADSLKERIPDVETYLGLSVIEKEQILNQYNDSTRLSLQLDSGIFVVEEHPILKKISLSDKITTIAVDDSWNYVLVVRDPEEALPFKEIRGRVISDYQQILENNWLGKLKEKFPVEVHKPELTNIYKKFENL